MSEVAKLVGKAAWSYCRRCLAVMLCCVLAFGFTVRTAPRAKAVVLSATATVAGGITLKEFLGNALIIWTA